MPPRKPRKPGRKPTAMLKGINPIVADFERHMGISTLAAGGRMLGMTYQGYAKFRHVRDLPLIHRLALAAIMRGVAPLE